MVDQNPVHETYLFVLSNVAAFIINSSSCQFQIGSSSTQIFTCVSLESTAI